MGEIVEGEDRISELPVHIIHNILRRICQNSKSNEVAAQTRFLSKTWNSIWRTRPIVFIIHPDFLEKMEDFIKFVDDSLHPYVEQNFRIEKLYLRCLHIPELTSHIDRWIKLAMICKVESLTVYTSLYDSEYYAIPDSIYASNKTMLSVLHLHLCNFEIDKNSTTNKLQGLISTNPLIRDLRLLGCTGFQNFCVSGLVYLERLELCCCQGLVKVEIRAPNLRKFRYAGVAKTGEPKPLPCTIDILDGYNTLESLNLRQTSMTDKQLEYYLSKFSALTDLALTACFEMKNLKIVSENLETFNLARCRNLEQVNMLAPNLMNFYFDGYKMPFSVSSIDPSSLEKAQLYFRLVDTSWYNNLQDFLQKFNYSKGLVLAIRCNAEDRSILIYEDPREIVVPPSPKLLVQIGNPSMSLQSFVNDQIRWSPKIISIVSCMDSKLLQVFRETTTTYTEKQQRGLNEVTIHKGAVEIEKDNAFYTWLKSKPLIERTTTFSFKWDK